MGTGQAGDQWFRGNTHTHTVLCGHADSEPDVVAAWYLNHGYNFVILSEHNQFIDPSTVNLPENRRDDFILIPGVEVTGKKHVHSTAMNVDNVVPWKFDHAEKSAIIQNHVDGTIEAGGQAILNHPNWASRVAAEEMLPVEDLYMFELFNGHPHVHNEGVKDAPSTEKMWDHLLTEGMLMYGVSSDDAHHFKTITKDKSNPGRGWVMVQAATLDPDMITKAMVEGKFYASNGVFLETCERGPGTYVIKVDAERTRQELIALPVLRGKSVEKGTVGFRIDFIGPKGKILETTHGEKARFTITKSYPYVRAKVTFTRAHPESQELEEYYAWGQPAFTDARSVTGVSARSAHNAPIASNGE
jgi:predicted metal-dependent phosphoesterase TrpH